jgi:hypothetical protein
MTNDNVLTAWEEVLTGFEPVAQSALRFHSEMWGRRQRSEDRLMVAVVACGALTGTSALSVFALLPDLPAKILIGTLGIATAVLAGLQQHFRFGQRAAEHRQAVGRAEEALATIRILKLFPPKSISEAKETFAKLNAAVLGIRGPASSKFPGRPRTDAEVYESDLIRLSQYLRHRMPAPAPDSYQAEPRAAADSGRDPAMS